MCETCWNEAGCPIIDNPGVRRAAELARKVYEAAPTGGNLHIVLDDWNTEDQHLRWCLNEAADIDHPLLEVERECAEQFLRLTQAERDSALALSEGMWSIGA